LLSERSLTQMSTGRTVIFAIAAAAVIVVVVGAVFREPILARWDSPSNNNTVVLSGNIEAHESVLSFKTVQSRIVQLPFNEGQWVTKGTLVAAVDDSDYRQQVSIAEAGLAVQKRQLDTARKSLEAAGRTIAVDDAELAQRKLDYSRNLELRKQGFVSAAVLDQADTTLKQVTAVLERDRALQSVAERNVKVAQAGVKNSEEALALSRIIHGYTLLSAPFDGVITVRQAELGEVVVPGTPVVTMADLDHIWLRAYLNETDVGKVSLGQEVVVTTDSRPNKQYGGRLSFIASKAEFTPKSVETHAERVTLVYRVKIDVANPTHELLPGMPADARIKLREPDSR
jgi:HlyD family secretion protein